FDMPKRMVRTGWCGYPQVMSISTMSVSGQRQQHLKRIGKRLRVNWIDTSIERAIGNNTTKSKKHLIPAPMPGQWFRLRYRLDVPTAEIRWGLSPDQVPKSRFSNSCNSAWRLSLTRGRT